MNYASILEEAKQETTHFFHLHEKSGFIYHNLDHTQQVVKHAMELARHYRLSEEDAFIVTCAAWFHDTGYFIQDGTDHEKRGAAKAADFLRSRQVAEPVIQSVEGCILATVIPQSPHNLLEQIVCDADLYHLGTSDFDELNKRMRKEMEWRLGRKISKHEWRIGAIRLLENHHYQTAYGQEHLEKRKQDNLNKLRHKEEEEEAAEQAAAPTVFQDSDEPIEARAVKEKKPKSDRPERGIETMFRISSGNHQRLSDMADNKSHIMITTTSIIISVLLSLLLRRLEDNQYLTIPTILLLIVCVITMVFSILATRPSLPSGMFTQEDLREKKVNLLFFGNFYRMSYEDYREGMQQMMNDRDFLYGTLTRDLYAQGIVLGRKYRMLRIAYNVFMFGIVASVFAFMIAVFFFSH
ncbi:MAG TPA: Pycsar system effector family protein [Puia sp.]|nr:Pycsar system effector family protein [Puia sp.]